MSAAPPPTPLPEGKNAKKRTKWEPAAIMVLLLGLGLWIAFGPASKPKFAVRPGAVTQEVRIAETRGELEAAKEPGATDYTFRLFIAPSAASAGSTSPLMTRSEAERVFGSSTVTMLVSPQQNRVFRGLFRTFNITSMTSLVWVLIGFVGQATFSGRFIFQWIASERSRRSVIGESFWWMSLIGGVILFSYFVWRQDPVAMLGQSTGIVIYARNIRLMRKHARRTAREGVA